MTSAQANRPRLEVWKDILISVGGVPHNGDGLYQTVRAVAIALGAAPLRGATMNGLARMIIAASPAVFSSNGRPNGHLLPGAGIALTWGTDPATASPGGSSGPIFGDPGTGVVLGDPTIPVVFGTP